MRSSKDVMLREIARKWAQDTQKDADHELEEAAALERAGSIDTAEACLAIALMFDHYAKQWRERAGW